MIKNKFLGVAFLMIILSSGHAFSKTKKTKVGESEGLVVRSESEASLAIRDVAARLSEIKQRSTAAHNRLLAIQDMLAQDSQDTATLDISLSGETANVYKVLDAEFYLNQILIVNYTQPVTFDENKTTFPVFSGNLPFGQYELTAKITTGILPYGAAFKLAQGQWLAEKTFKFNIDKSGKLSKTIVLKKADDGPVLDWVEQTKGDK